MCLHIIVHVYLYNYDKMFIDKLQIVLKSLLTCKIHKSALEYSIIRRYTNVVYYYLLLLLYGRVCERGIFFAGFLILPNLHDI